MAGTDDLEDGDDVSAREKATALYRVAAFHPPLALGVVGLSVLAASLEGVGLSFIVPIIEVARSADGAVDPGPVFGVFAAAYDLVGVPLRLATLVGGVALVMVVRFTASFLVGWLRAAIETKYVRHLQETAFDRALDADVAYFDREGSDDILNAIVTQAEYAGQVIRYALIAVEQSLLAAIYFLIALVIAPVLTLLTAAFLGGLTYLFRNVIAEGYSLGDAVADAKETIQSNAQAGTQGIREVKLFDMGGELRAGFRAAADRFERSRIALYRNESAIKNFYQLATAISVFVLIYLALGYAALTVGELGLFLFAMYRLGPKVSAVNQHVYRVEGQLAHLVRTQAFVERLARRREDDGGDRPVPATVDRVEYDDVTFTYEGDADPVLSGVSFAFDREDVVAFVGPSGAGKSTIVSLLARLYEPDSGEIRADGVPINAFDRRDWRARVSVVRQDPHLFNDTLRRNVTVGNRGATAAELEAVCETARVTEFLDQLPDGYDTVLGDRGVRLSGGQRQRVAIARALLGDADVLVLDEATSDLDTSLERAVQEGIAGMDREFAVLVIAHRLSTVTDADRIHAVRGGEIVESGTHEQLLETDGLYASLLAAQRE